MFTKCWLEITICSLYYSSHKTSSFFSVTALSLQVTASALSRSACLVSLSVSLLLSLTLPISHLTPHSPPVLDPDFSITDTGPVVLPCQSENSSTILTSTRLSRVLKQK